MKITKANVDRKPYTSGGQVIYWDTELKGFGICIGMRSKSYLVQRTQRDAISGLRRSVKINIGRHGVLTPEQARDDAREILVKFTRGVDPRAARRVEQAKAITLHQAWKHFLLARRVTPRTEVHYRRCVEHYLRDWLHRPLISVSRREIAERFIVDKERLGPSKATRNMRVFRAIYNFARDLHEELPECPTIQLKRLRLWHRDRKRTTYLRSDELPVWYDAVMALPNETARDYLRLVLFTGMRRAEAMTLRWENIDFARRTLMVPKTKNGEPLVLPLSSIVFDLLRARRRKAADSPWVFPGESASGHLQEPKKWVNAIRIATGLTAGLHDLRRTFATVGVSINIDLSIVQRLLNHRPGREAIFNYVILDVEQLRGPAQRIAERLVKLIHAPRADTGETGYPNGRHRHDGVCLRDEVAAKHARHGRAAAGRYPAPREFDY